MNKYIRFTYNGKTAYGKILTEDSTYAEDFFGAGWCYYRIKILNEDGEVAVYRHSQTIFNITEKEYLTATVLNS